MLATAPLITITSTDRVERLTREECMLRARGLAERVQAAKGTLTRERVALGWFLLQCKAEMRHGEFTAWLGGGLVHLKTARRCMRLAAAVGDAGGGVDRVKLFGVLHAARPDLFASIDTFDADRVSMARVEAALDLRERVQQVGGRLERLDIDTPCVGEKGQGLSFFTTSGGADDVGCGNGMQLPRARVRDVAGQGVLGELFAPLAARIEAVCRVYDTLSDRQRGRLAKLNEFYSRKAAEIVGATSDIRHPTSDIDRPPRDGGAYGSPSAPPVESLHRVDRNNDTRGAGH